MTLAQMEYVLEVLRQQSFAKAAAKLGLTQPTLSMQISKLEEELGQLLINRDIRPIEPTKSGSTFVQHAEEILASSQRLEDIYKNKSIIPSEVRVGIIPTISPSLVPRVLPELTAAISSQILVNEMTTDEIVTGLADETLDVGILATPLRENTPYEYTLFQEDFFVYLPNGNPLLNQERVSKNDVKKQKLILLDEGHCLRDQVLQLCSRENMQRLPFGFKTGNLETIIKLVDRGMGVTILPLMATLDLSKAQKARLRRFSQTQPARQVSLVGRKFDNSYDFVRRIITSLEKSSASMGLQIQEDVQILPI